MPNLRTIVYNASPIWLQNFGISCFGYSIRRVRFGTEFDRLFAEFLQRQWHSLGQLKTYQDEQLRLLILHAYENVPHYRRVMDQRKLKPGDIQTAEDLPKLPVLQRETMKYNLDSLRARNIPRRKLFYGETSGTTGNPSSVYWSRHMVVVNAVVEWRLKTWAGVKLGDPMAALMASRGIVPARQKSPPFWRSNRPMNQLLMSALHMREENLGHYVDALLRFRPVALEAYPSTALRLARFVLDHGLSLKIPTVLTTSEALYPGHRRTIERAFGSRVFDHYGMAERIVFATECEEHAGLHLNLDYGVTEILDSNDQPVPANKPGRMVGTALHNFGMPLIRLATTDTLAISDETCTCGRKFPLIAQFTGRTDDYLVTPDGRMLPSNTLALATDEISRLAEAQIVQNEPARICVKVVKGKGYTDSDTRTLLSNLRRILGEEVSVDLEFVLEIPKPKSGKHRWIVSKARWDQQLLPPR